MKTQPRTTTRPTDMIQALEPRQLRSADLQITDVVMTPLVTSAGQSFNVEFHIWNSGTTATTKPAFIRTVLSRDNAVGNADDVLLDTNAYSPNIPAGGHVVLKAVSGTGLSQSTGSFRVGGIIDQVGLITESNENNNTKLSMPGALTIAEFLDHDSLLGTAGDDVFEISVVSDRAIIVMNGAAYSRPIGFFGKQLFIDAGPGNDRVVATSDFPIRMAITGSGGNDTLVGGSGDDELSGANGRDRVYGGAGFDFVLGGSGSDRLFGDAGRDTLSGGRGNDRLDAGTGTDLLVGGADNDQLFAQDGTTDYRDSLYGSAGIDTATADSEDILEGCEQ